MDILIHMLTKEDLEQIARLLQPLSEGQKRLEQRLDRIEQTLNREVKDLAENTKEIMIKLNKLDDHERRIKQLEEDHLSTHKN